MANFDLSKLMEGRNPQAVMLEETRGLKTKWEQTGLLEGLNQRDQHGVSILLENQAKQLLDEATATSTSAGSEEWSGVALPLVRRIFGEISAKEFVSVQPMNLPSGLIFYLDFKYGTNQKGNPLFNNKSLYGGDGTDLGSTNVAQHGLYGEGRWGYTNNDLTSAAINSGSITEATASWSEVGFDGALSASAAAGEITKLTIPIATIDANLDQNGARTFVISGSDAGSTISETQNISQFHAIAGTDVVFFVSASAGLVVDESDTVTVHYSIEPSEENRGDFEDRDPILNASGSAGTALDIPEVDLELKSEAIVAKTKKLKAVWTPELAQDLNAYHSIDAEAELTSMLSEYISLEIDLEILDLLKTNALTVDYWSTNIGEEYNSVTSTWSAATAGVAYQKNTWFQTLGTKLNKVSNKIHQLTLRGGANFIVCSPDVATILESIPGFTVNAGKDAMSYAAGVTQVGAISNRYQVYKNPYMTSNEILMGFKGSNFLETGAVYAPYVPLIMTPLVYDPQNFTPRRGVMTRYAKKMVRPEFYGKIYIKDLQNV